MQPRFFQYQLKLCDQLLVTLHLMYIANDNIGPEYSPCLKPMQMSLFYFKNYDKL